MWDKRARLFWRYFADGSPDVGWGARWNTAVPPGTVMLFNAWGVIPNGQGISPKEMEVASDGSMILVGTVDRGYPTYKDVWLARINANGTLDTGFGEAGQVITDLGGADDAAASGIDANGRLLVAAYARPTGPAGDLRMDWTRRFCVRSGLPPLPSWPLTRPSRPAIAKLSPTRGRRGNAVTTTGKNFGNRRGTGYVKFGAAKCGTYLTWSSTRIRCKVPAKARFARLRVTVTSRGGTGGALVFTVKR